MRHQSLKESKYARAAREQHVNDAFLISEARDYQKQEMSMNCFRSTVEPH